MSASCTSSKYSSSIIFSKGSSPALLSSNTLVSMLYNLELNCSINFLKDFLDGEVDQTLLTSYSGKSKIFNALSDKIHFNNFNQLLALATAAHARFGSLNMNRHSRILSLNSCSLGHNFPT